MFTDDYRTEWHIDLIKREFKLPGIKNKKKQNKLRNKRKFKRKGSGVKKVIIIPDIEKQKELIRQIMTPKTKLRKKKHIKEVL